MTALEPAPVLDLDAAIQRVSDVLASLQAQRSAPRASVQANGLPAHVAPGELIESAWGNAVVDDLVANDSEHDGFTARMAAIDQVNNTQQVTVDRYNFEFAPGMRQWWCGWGTGPFSSGGGYLAMTDAAGDYSLVQIVGSLSAQFMRPMVVGVSIWVACQGTTGDPQTFLRLNGNPGPFTIAEDVGVAHAGNYTLNLTVVMPVNVGDYLNLTAQQVAGGANLVGGQMRITELRRTG